MLDRDDFVLAALRQRLPPLGRGMVDVQLVPAHHYGFWTELTEPDPLDAL